jgi:hypothetical protein
MLVVWLIDRVAGLLLALRLYIGLLNYYQDDRLISRGVLCLELSDSRRTHPRTSRYDLTVEQTGKFELSFCSLLFSRLLTTRLTNQKSNSNHFYLSSDRAELTFCYRVLGSSDSSLCIIEKTISLWVLDHCIDGFFPLCKSLHWLRSLHVWSVQKVVIPVRDSNSRRQWWPWRGPLCYLRSSGFQPRTQRLSVLRMRNSKNGLRNQLIIIDQCVISW